MRALSLKRILPAVILVLTAALLPGCRMFPGEQVQEKEAAGAPMTLGIMIDPTAPEEVGITWEPESVSIEGAEVTVTYDDSSTPRTVTVTIQLQPDCSLETSARPFGPPRLFSRR